MLETSIIILKWTWRRVWGCVLDSTGSGFKPCDWGSHTPINILRLHEIGLTFKSVTIQAQWLRSASPHSRGIGGEGQEGPMAQAAGLGEAPNIHLFNFKTVIPFKWIVGLLFWAFYRYAFAMFRQFQIQKSLYYRPSFALCFPRYLSRNKF